MVKKLFERFCSGFALTVLATLIVQLALSQAGLAAVTPGFAARFSSEAAAALAQLGLMGLIGVGFSMAALIFELERWSFLMQGIVHFLATAAVWMPVAWLCWHPVQGVGLWFSIGGWALTYVIVWLVQYLVMRRSVAQINRRLTRRNEDECC